MQTLDVGILNWKLNADSICRPVISIRKQKYKIIIRKWNFIEHGDLKSKVILYVDFSTNLPEFSVHFRVNCNGGSSSNKLRGQFKYLARDINTKPARRIRMIHSRFLLFAIIKKIDISLINYSRNWYINS